MDVGVGHDLAGDRDGASSVVYWANQGKSGAMTCIMPVNIYSWWVRFKNTSTEMRRWSVVILKGKRFGSLNK